MSSTYDPLVGHVLDGRYEILAKLARGGMATVYRARDQRLNRTVAVKVMRTDLGEDDEFIAKFDREARAAATLSHPSVVGVFDQGTAQGRPYIVMEYVEGETLRRLISREAPLSPTEALDLLEPIVSALACAHESGIVHRDIKPENALVSLHGQVKVADFGLARLVSSPQMTATGVLVGTASYLPPELVTHSRPDSRSDIYSVGIVAFEMLTGTKPHTGENNYQIAYRHVNVDIEPPSVRFLELGGRTWNIPDYVDALVQACTTRNPDDRIADGKELLRKLREVRAQLARDPVSDNPLLAARLRPIISSDNDATQAISPVPIQRPRPMSSGASPNGPRIGSAMPPPDAGRIATDSAPLWSTTSEPAPRPQPAQHTAPAPAFEQHSPGPTGARTPIFPQFHVSTAPVHRRRRRVLLVVLILLLTAAIAAGAWWWLAGRYTVVPALAAVPEVEALETAEANHLQTERAPEYSEDVDKGLVIDTDPEAGSRIPRGETLTITISLGPERYPMPAVVGSSLADATSALEEQNLVAGDITEAWSEEVEEGLVISASESSGTQLKPDTNVDLEVSKGREPIPVTDFGGKKAGSAQEDLEKAGFKVTVKEENSADVKKGRVISQSPDSGTGHRGDEIELTVSLGPVMVEVPDVRYEKRKDAEKLLTAAGFEVKVEEATGFPMLLDIASGTDPEHGEEAPEGSKVTLFIS